MEDAHRTRHLGKTCPAREPDRAPERRDVESPFSAKQQGRGDELDNLARSCHLCNSKKGPNVSGLDLETSALTRLFHPRTDRGEWAGQLSNRMRIRREILSASN